MNFSKLNNAQKTGLIEAATELSFYNKRIRPSRLTVCDELIKQAKDSGLTDFDKCDSNALCDWLLVNKPQPQKAVKVKPEPVEPVFLGSDTTRDDAIPCLPWGKYIVTGVQNNTAPHPSFATLQNIATRNAAKLLAMPMHYVRNLDKDQRKAVKYHSDIEVFLVEDDAFIGNQNGVRLAVKADIVVTAKKPINNALVLAGDDAITIVASPRCQSACRPRAKDESPSYAFTSRCSTVRHYTESRAGSESSADHWFGGIFLESTPDGIFVRPLEANEAGVINYLGDVYYPDGSRHAEQEKPAVVLGDLHIEKTDFKVWNDTVNWLKSVEPSLIVTHDTLDFSSRNHHNRNSDLFLYQQGDVRVIDELTQVVNQLNELADIAPLYVVASNHDDALGRWLDCPHYRAGQDTLNAKTYYFLKLALLEMADEVKLGGEPMEVLELALATLAHDAQLPELNDNITFGSVDEGKMVNGFDVSQHGHIGQGGARGSLATFKKYGTPNVTGHTHSGARDGHAIVVGVTGDFNMGYNKGLTTWSRDNALLHSNGTATLAPLYRVKVGK